MSLGLVSHPACLAVIALGWRVALSLAGGDVAAAFAARLMAGHACHGGAGAAAVGSGCCQPLRRSRSADRRRYSAGGAELVMAMCGASPAGLIAVAQGRSDAVPAADPRLEGAALPRCGAGPIPPCSIAASAWRGARSRLCRPAHVAVAGSALASPHHPNSRPQRPSFVMCLLIGCSLIAVLTTVGIVASLLFESDPLLPAVSGERLSSSRPTWNPQFRGGSDLGIWPLLWGTLYVSFIALLVAVPIGLMSAIYLSEYASQPHARLGQAGDRDAGRHPDHRLRPVRADHRRPVAARLVCPAAGAWRSVRHHR